MIVVALVDSDSYLKWGAATLDSVAPDAERHVVVVANPVMPSAAQRAAALAATTWAGQDIDVMSVDAAVAVVRDLEADAVLVAMRGPTAALVLGMLSTLRRRPVLWSGIPGIALPARRKALVFRAQADFMIVHSHRERAAFRALDQREGMRHRFALTTLPFLDRRPSGGDDIVFAAQALVPSRLSSRQFLVERLVETARAHPHRRVVLKVRARAGEKQTHEERFPLDSLLPDDVPSNLVVLDGPMSAVLDSAAAVVSVSSTAIIEAIARRIPALVLDDFGVGNRQLNAIFIRSGLIGSTADLVAGQFSLVNETWAHANYFHDPRDNDARDVLDSFLAERAREGLPVRPSKRSRVGGALRTAWYRRSALGSHDGRALGVLALAIGVPARAIVRATRKLSV